MDTTSPSQSPPQIDVANADLLLSTTRSVRKRLDFDRPVEREVLLECLELAVQAPTASNRQTWRWMMVTDQDLKTKIADVYREEGMGYLSGAVAEAENMERAPVLVLPCIEEDLSKGDQKAALVTAGSIVQAAWSFQLALRARGLGSTWTTLHLSQAQTVADLLGIPAGVTQVSLIPVAYTKGTDFKPARRPPVAEITSWNHWGDTGA